MTKNVQTIDGDGGSSVKPAKKGGDRMMPGDPGYFPVWTDPKGNLFSCDLGPLATAEDAENAGRMGVPLFNKKGYPFEYHSTLEVFMDKNGDIPLIYAETPVPHLICVGGPLMQEFAKQHGHEVH